MLRLDQIFTMFLMILLFMVLHFFVSFFFSFTETKYNLKKKKYLSPDENVEDRRPPTGNPNEENE